MEVDGHTYFTLTMINFMLAAAVGKTASLTGLSGQVESFESMATASKSKELEAPFLKALDAHQGIIIKICRAYSNTKTDEEDLFQEIVCQLWQGYQSFQGTAQVSTWMHTVALRTAIMPFRRRSQKVEIEIREVLPDRPVENEQVQTDGDDRLFELFDRLGNFERAVLTLMLEGYTQKEIASMLNLTEGTVKMRMKRVRKKIDEY